MMNKYFRFKEFISEEIKKDRLHIYCLITIFILSIVIRTILIFIKHMESDEGVAACMFTMQPLFKAISYYPQPGNHVFFTLLSSILWRLFGMNPIVLRFPAFIGGILLILASYLFIRAFYNKHSALLAAAFVGASDSLIYYSISARGYSLLVLFFLLVFTIGIYLKQNNNKYLWITFVVLSALGFYTIPIMLYPFGIVIMWLFLSIILDINNRRLLLKNLLISIIATFILTFILYSPIIIVSGLKSLIANKAIARREWPVFIAQISPAASEVWNAWNKGIPSVIKFFMILCFFVSLFFHKKLSFHRVPILLATALWVIPVFIYLRTDLVNLHRIWLFLLPLYLGMVSAGIYYLLTKFKFVRDHKSLVFGIISIIIILTLGGNVFQSRLNTYLKIKGTLKDPDYVTIFLKNIYEPGDRFIYSWLGWDVNLDYNFILHGYPPKAWNTNPRYAKRLLVYVDHDSKETLESAMNNAGLKITDYTSIKILIHDKHATIYALKSNKKEDTEISNIKSYGTK